MASIKSDLTNKKYPGTQLRQLTVPDESGASEELYDYSQDEGPPPNSEELDLNAINARLASRGLPPLDAAGQRAVAARNAQRGGSFGGGSFGTGTEAVREFEKISEARKVKTNGRERLSESARRRVEILCGLFSPTKNVDVDGQSFTVRTLSGEEIKESLVAASEFDGTVALPFETRKQYLARALTQVAGADINTFLGDSSLETKVDFVAALPEPLLGVLFNEYLKLVNETNKKYAIKNEADAQEVAADLKK